MHHPLLIGTGIVQLARNKPATRVGQALDQGCREYITYYIEPASAVQLIYVLPDCHLHLYTFLIFFWLPGHFQTWQIGHPPPSWKNGQFFLAICPGEPDTGPSPIKI
jgi:hypothetical protein